MRFCRVTRHVLGGNSLLIPGSCRQPSCSQPAASGMATVAGTAGPAERYQQLVNQGQLRRDSHQLAVAERLQQLHEQLLDYRPPEIRPVWWWNRWRRRWRRVPSSSPPPTPPAQRGLYLWGSVGSGKTMLMDLFFSCAQVQRKRRVHFHEFMTDVHRRVHANKLAQAPAEGARLADGWHDPIAPVAAEISADAWLICFDEFQVTDIADAMILRSLFGELFRRGSVMVATSNRPPDHLYRNGLQRAHFVPFIGALKLHCAALCLDSGVDYRTVDTPQCRHRQTYFVKSAANAETVTAAVDALFKLLAAQETDEVRARTLRVQARDVTLQRTCGRIADCTFSELCDRALGAADYIAMANVFHTVFIRDIPVLNARRRGQTRRFITLIDTLYNQKVRVVVTAYAPLNKLFSNETYNLDQGHDALLDTSSRQLLDDLDLNQSSACQVSLFTGEEELFAVDRAVSRLQEMQSDTYWRQWHGHL